MTTIMVTGVGAIIGYGLVRSIRVARQDVYIVGTDIYPDAVGQAWCDSFEKAPLTACENYLDWFNETVRRHNVDLVIPGIEQDVHRLSAARDCFVGLSCKVALNSKSLIEVSSDKWKMDEELLAVGDPARIPSVIGGDFDSLVGQFGLPFILKPRRSYASKGLVIVRQVEDFKPHADRLGEVLLAQPIVGKDEEEYTLGVFGDGRGEICASITLQRRLAGDGSTAKAWVRQVGGLDETVSRLCRHFKPLGPTNLQFRRDGTEWKLLEINPRISSTTSIRTAFGYNEAAMCMEYYLNGKLPVQPAVRDGFAARYIEDKVVYGWDHF
jgi:carbamoyl-phosphate synthase large subunit